MAPVFRDGDNAWVDPDVTAADACFVGVRDPRSGTTVIRWLGREDGCLVLRTLDLPGVERTLVGDEEMQIEGMSVLVGSRPQARRWHHEPYASASASSKASRGRRAGRSAGAEQLKAAHLLRSAGESGTLHPYERGVLYRILAKSRFVSMREMDLLLELPDPYPHIDRLSTTKQFFDRRDVPGKPVFRFVRRYRAEWARTGARWVVTGAYFVFSSWRCSRCLPWRCITDSMCRM